MRIAMCLVLSLAALTSLWAHSDPRGDTHPTVVVQDGTFVICFGNNDAFDMEQRPMWKMSFTTDGQVILPRHRLSAEQLEEWQRRLKGEASWDVTTVKIEGQGKRAILREIVNGRKQSYPLPLASGALFAETTGKAGDEVGFAWSEPRMTVEEDAILKFSCVSLKTFFPGITVELGPVATIYDFPRVSNPVWAAARWWVAWVRPKPGDKAKEWSEITWQTVITSIDPVTGQLVHEVRPELSHWNTSLSLKTAGGWMCAAWHASIDGTYPGHARIVTAFKKLPE
ncbi:MAG: hypothetical protein IAE77_28395 [Prosthecobacter sp.]|jgi:hypothetical protein|uniref:hypothetical protein n=1 Tax=Prosthecobacter sp. TaxID=1965333 RepID=UPI0019DDB3A5|nr:hypothetical protein [Prosthecobacter sp.]MBE2287408.1 hypothetical protein [Prosthecobacter sp.]